MRVFLAALVAISLSACQTIGIESDNQATIKQAIAVTSIAVDTVGAYGNLPDCAPGVGSLCKKPKAYTDAKLIAHSFVDGLKITAAQDHPSVFLSAGLLYFQFQLAKTIADAPSPTDPEAPPSIAVEKQLAALKLADILVSTADSRVKDAASPNTTVEELIADLDARVNALPN